MRHAECVLHDPLCLKPERFTERVVQFAPAVNRGDEPRLLFRVCGTSFEDGVPACIGPLA